MGVNINQSAIFAMVIVFSPVFIVSGTKMCDNAQCEPQINASLGQEFNVSLDFNPSMGFEWWINFDPNYLTLSNSAFIGDEKLFSFKARNTGDTEVIMLYLEPLENGTIAERKIFPINIIPLTTEPKPLTIPNRIANLETAAELKTVPINVVSAAAALKQANVQSNHVNAEPINISKKDFQMSTVIGAPSQADTRKSGPRGSAI